MLADIAAAGVSVHVNQFGVSARRRSATRSRMRSSRRRARGCSGQARRRPPGVGPRGRVAGALRPSVAAGVEVCVVRGRSRGCRRARSAPTGRALNLNGLGHIDHRKFVVVDGRIGWVGGAGIEDHFQDGRFHDLFVRVEGPVAAQLQLVFVGELSGGSAATSRRGARSSCPLDRRGAERSRRPSSTTLLGATGRSPMRSPTLWPSRARDDARRRQPVRDRPAA